MVTQGVGIICMHNCAGCKCGCLRVASCCTIQGKGLPFVTSAFGCLVCVLAAWQCYMLAWRGRPPWAAAVLVGQGGHSMIVVVAWRSCGVRFAAAAAVSRTRTCGSGARACTE